MTKLSLGKSSLAVSPMAWGMWRFKGSDVKAARARVEAALAAGLTFLDTADIYGPDNDEPFGAAEALFGQVLKDAPQIRDQVVLASKGGIVMGTPYDSSAAYLESAVEASLSRMGIDKIDLYQIHRPDHLAHPAQVAQVLTRLRSAGKIGEVGLSNHTAAQVSALQAHLAFPIACVQIEFSPLVVGPLYDGTLDQALETGMGVMAWSPLAQGRLADGPSTDERVLAVRAELDRLAAAHGVSRTVAAYAWLLAHPAGPIPIIGSQQPERIAEAAKALAVQLTRPEWYAVLTAARGVPLP
ncbi:MAG: aldo/keto reductase [Phenylobacterium sp.]|uniref:aldo/keto reductase n=1 Tax=Phenylobacterium sp. TaxID=1871053 RepID=UPI0027305D9C|nr:aldo/keto reductase [Phenylobacterium sp.]MDP2012047.1 aldo/keto reductase [Phenylobacterium sp.]MDP3634918.1 aldo/keto reductase [Phenylobacterium sp.]MDP3869454.1 aldo/keto reductase [Phenylobacterium sp.]